MKLNKYKILKIIILILLILDLVVVGYDINKTNINSFFLIILKQLNIKWVLNNINLINTHKYLNLKI